MACSNAYFPPGQDKADIDGFTVRYADMQQLEVYANRVGSSDGRIPKTVHFVVLASLATNRITYCRKSQGDCGTPGSVSLGVGGSISRGTKAASAFDPEPISRGILAGIGAITGFFTGAHHAQAVLTEQTRLCGVANDWNGFAEAMEVGLSSGKVQLQDAMVQLKLVYSTLVSEAQSIEKPYNAAFHYHKALDALKIWNEEIVFPSLPPSSLSGLTGTLPRAALIGGGILVGAKVLGAI